MSGSDYDKYIPKYVSEENIGFIQHDIKSIEHRDNRYVIAFVDDFISPGVIIPDNLGFEPKADMKVIWDSGGHLGAEGDLSFYTKDGKQLCALHKERMSAVWHNITPENADKIEKESGQQEDETGMQDIRNTFIASRLRKIRRHYGYILEDQEELAQSDGEYAEELKAGIENSREAIEKAYEKINPELASLRKKVKEGTMKPEERREAVKAYYHKKQSRESR